jgi:hypothetical protein
MLLNHQKGIIPFQGDQAKCADQNGFLSTDLKGIGQDLKNDSSFSGRVNWAKRDVVLMIE